MPYLDKMNDDATGAAAAEIQRTLERVAEAEPFAGESGAEEAERAVDAVTQEAGQTMAVLDRAVTEQPGLGLEQADVSGARALLAGIKAHTEGLVAKKKAEAKQKIEAVVVTIDVAAEVPAPVETTESAAVLESPGEGPSAAVTEQTMVAAEPSAEIPQEQESMSEQQMLERGVEKNLRRIQEIVLGLVYSPRLAPEEVALRSQELQAIIQGNISAFHELSAMSKGADAAEGLYATLADTHASAMDVVDAARDIFLVPDLTPGRRAVIQQDVSAKMEVNARHWDEIERFKSEAPKVQLTRFDSKENDPSAEKMQELDDLAAKVNARMQEIFSELMRMKVSGGKLEASELDTYRKMLDEDPLLNEFVQKLKEENQNEKNSADVRTKALQLAVAFAEGARTQEAFAAQMARHDAEQTSGGAVAVAAVAAGVAMGAAGEKTKIDKPAGKREEQVSEEPPDTNETSSIQGARSDAARFQRAMDRAKEWGQIEQFDENLGKMIKAKKLLLENLKALPLLSQRQKNEIERLTLEIGKWEKEAEIRKMLAELKEMEREDKGLEAQEKTLENGNDPEALARVRERRAGLKARIQEKNQRVEALRGQQEGIDKLMPKESKPVAPVNVAEMGANVGSAIVHAALDPQAAGLKVLDWLIQKGRGDDKARH